MTTELTATTHLHEQNSPGERRAAARTVAILATDDADCALLLDMLGLDAEPTA